MRTFTTMEMPEEVIQDLIQCGRWFAGEGVKAVWVKPEAMHLTLRFQGETSAEQLAVLRKCLAETCARTKPFELALSAPGAFPSPRNPSVLWMGLMSSQSLSVLQRDTEDAAIATGFPPEKHRFSPHLTLARFKPRHHPLDLTHLLPEAPRCFSRPFVVHELVLFESMLTREGPQYKRIANWPFGAVADDEEPCIPSC